MTNIEKTDHDEMTESERSLTQAMVQLAAAARKQSTIKAYEQLGLMVVAMCQQKASPLDVLEAVSAVAGMTPEGLALMSNMGLVQDCRAAGEPTFLVPPMGEDELPN